MKLTTILFAFIINIFNPYFINAEELVDSSNNQIESTLRDKSISNQIHIVKVGDTITNISKFYSIEKEFIIKLNNLKDENYIYVGQNLKLSDPNKEFKNQKKINSFHVVQKGESLTEISAKYNLNSKFLTEINNINNPDSLEVGSKIFLSDNNIINQKTLTLSKDVELNKLISEENKTYGPLKTQQVELEEVSGRKILNVLNANDNKLIIAIDCERKSLDVRIPYRKWRGWKPAKEEFEMQLINDFCKKF